MSSRSHRSAIAHSVSFRSSGQAGSCVVYASYTHHPDWFRVYPSIEDASHHLGIGTEEIDKASNTSAQLFTIVPVIDTGALIPPSDLDTSQLQTQPYIYSGSPSNGIEGSVEPACLPRTDQSRGTALSEAPQGPQSPASIQLSVAQSRLNRPHRRGVSSDTKESGKPGSQQALTEANSLRARRLYVRRLDDRPGFELRLPEGATREGKDFFSLASMASGFDYVGDKPVGKDGVRLCTLQGRDTGERFIVAMSRDKALCEQASIDTADNGNGTAGCGKK